MISPRNLIQARNRAQYTYQHHADIVHEIADRLLQRLDYVKLQPKRILDLGCAEGYATLFLRQRFRTAQIIAIEPAEKLCRPLTRKWFSPIRVLTAWYANLPLMDQTVDIIYSNLSLQWQSDWPMLAREILRVLKPNGLFLFSVAGPDTLQELRTAWATIDNLPHIISFKDMHDIGDILLQQGFDAPVMDMELLHLHYPTLTALWRELHGLGCQNVLQQRCSHLIGKQHFATMQQAVQQTTPCSVTLEVIYGHAWKAVPAEAVAANTTINIPISAIKKRG